MCARARARACACVRARARACVRARACLLACACVCFVYKLSFIVYLSHQKADASIHIIYAIMSGGQRKIRAAASDEMKKVKDIAEGKKGRIGKGQEGGREAGIGGGVGGQRTKSVDFAPTCTGLNIDHKVTGVSIQKKRVHVTNVSVSARHGGSLTLASQ